MATAIEVIVLSGDDKERDASSLCSKVIEFLLNRQIISPFQRIGPSFSEMAQSLGDRIDQSIFSNIEVPNGYPPGPMAHVVVNEHFDEGGGIVYPCYLETIVGRQMHGPFEESPAWIECPKCEAKEEPSMNWHDAVDRWAGGGNDAKLNCRGCREMAFITEWKCYPASTFGILGFKFWNWPKLKDRFVSTIGRVLGHKVSLVEDVL